MNDLGGYLWLVPCRTADAAATADAVMRLVAVFGFGRLWVSYRGSQFKNEVMRRVQKVLKAKHQLNATKCPWSNGTIDSACKQVIRDFCAVLSELEMYADECPEVVNLVQRVLKISMSTRLNWRMPMQVFTEHVKTISLALMFKEHVPVNAPLDLSKRRNVWKAEKLSMAMSVLCVAKDETSVDIMCRRLCCNFLRKS
jgi:hypothetical protein